LEGRGSTGQKHDAEVSLGRKRIGKDVLEGLEICAWSLVHEELNLCLVEGVLLGILSLEVEDGSIERLAREVELIRPLEWLEGDIDGLRLLASGRSLAARERMNWFGEGVLDEVGQ
jgi:hypothetical protein